MIHIVVRPRVSLNERKVWIMDHATVPVAASWDAHSQQFLPFSSRQGYPVAFEKRNPRL